MKPTEDALEQIDYHPKHLEASMRSPGGVVGDALAPRSALRGTRLAPRGRDARRGDRTAGCAARCVSCFNTILNTLVSIVRGAGSSMFFTVAKLP